MKKTLLLLLIIGLILILASGSLCGCSMRKSFLMMDDESIANKQLQVVFLYFLPFFPVYPQRLCLRSGGPSRRWKGLSMRMMSSPNFCMHSQGM